MERILHVIGGTGLGGTETYIMNIYRNIDKSKIQFDFVIYDNNSKNSFYQNEIIMLGGRVIELEDPKKAGFLKTICEMRKIIRHGRYQVVHSHTMFNSGISMLAAWLEKVEIRIAHSHSTGSGASISIRQSAYRKIMKLLINIFANRYCGCSRKAAEYLFSKKNIDKYLYMQNTVDFDEFINLEVTDSRDIRKELSIPQDAKIIGHVGRFGKPKNHDFIIEMFSKLVLLSDNLYLILIGDGPTRSIVQERARQLRLENKIRFLGIRTDVPKLMNIMDCFILPSFYEGFGIVLIEAQVSGLPCIVSENIQPEVDMGLGLIKRVNLDDENKWINEITYNLDSKIHNKKTILEAIDKSPFKMETTVNKFYSLYNNKM